MQQRHDILRLTAPLLVSTAGMSSSSAQAGFLPPLSRRSSPQGSRSNSAEEKQQTSARRSRRSSRELGTERDKGLSLALKQPVRTEDTGREPLQAAAQQSWQSSPPSSSSASPRRASLPPRLGQAKISVPLPRDLIVKAAVQHRTQRPVQQQAALAASPSHPNPGSSPSPMSYDATWERARAAESGLLHNAAFTRTTVADLMREAERGRREDGSQQATASGERLITPSSYAPPPPRTSFISPAQQPPSLSSSPASSSPSSVSDSAMISSLTQRVLTLESLAQQQSRQLAAKDSSVRQLEQELSRASAAAARAASDDGAEAELSFLRQEQSRLSRQVYEMEHFLADYGMQWVGDEAEAATAGDAAAASPSASLPFDLPLFQSRIAELNTSLPASTLTVSSSSARFSPPPRLTLTLLADGIALPPPLPTFLPYASSSCQRLVRDVMDGYWPGEWRERWPDGVRLELLLRTELSWEDEKRRRERRRQRSFHAFEGEGRKLRDEDNGQEAVAPPAGKGKDGQQSQRPPQEKQASPTQAMPDSRAAPRLSREEFLSRLPASTLSAGRLVDIRAAIAQRLPPQGETRSTAPSVWETLPIKATAMLSSIRSLTSHVRPPFPAAVGPVCVLRIHLHQQRPAASAASVSSSSFLLLFGCHDLLESVTVSLLEAVRGEPGMAGRSWRLRWASLYPRAVVELDELPSTTAAQLQLPAAEGRRSLSELRWSPNCSVFVRARALS